MRQKRGPKKPPIFSVGATVKIKYDPAILANKGRRVLVSEVNVTRFGIRYELLNMQGPWRHDDLVYVKAATKGSVSWVVQHVLN